MLSRVRWRRRESGIVAGYEAQGILAAVSGLSATCFGDASLRTLLGRGGAALFVDLLPAQS